MTEVFEHHCALVDSKNECNGCSTAGRIKQAERAKKKTALEHDREKP
jgi:hypothetical protein